MEVIVFLFIVLPLFFVYRFSLRHCPKRKSLLISSFEALVVFICALWPTDLNGPLLFGSIVCFTILNGWIDYRAKKNKTNQ